VGAEKRGEKGEAEPSQEENSLVSIPSQFEVEVLGARTACTSLLGRAEWHFFLGAVTPDEISIEGNAD
jgi:hypothetical protein